MFQQKLALGSVQFGTRYGISNSTGMTPQKEVREIIAYCQEQGITTIDTAYAYGKSEEVLGLHDLSRFDLVSKFLPASELVPCVQEQLRISLQRLNIPCLYGYLAHRPAYVLQNRSVWTFLNEAKQAGLIKKIGFSLTDPQEMDKLIKANMLPDMVQLPFNYFDNRFAATMRLLKERYNTEVHVRSVFLQGLFFTEPDKLAAFFDPVKDYLLDLQNNYRPLHAYLLNYVISNDWVDKVVVGVNNKKQLIENVAALKHPLNLPRFDGKIDAAILNPANWPNV